MAENEFYFVEGAHERYGPKRTWDLSDPTMNLSRRRPA